MRHDLDQLTQKIAHLTNREEECLQLVGEGKTAGEIALILGISRHTVHGYLKEARTKLDCCRTVQAVATFLKAKL